MGVVKNITYQQFPVQGNWLGRRVRVCFHGDTEHLLHGTIIRHDLEPPFRTIIQLDDGRVVLADECQYSRG